jgi:hypothetical protein
VSIAPNNLKMIAVDGKVASSIETSAWIGLIVTIPLIGSTTYSAPTGGSVFVARTAFYADVQGLSLATMRAISANPDAYLGAARRVWMPSGSAALFPTLSAAGMTGITTTGGRPTVSYTF